MRSSVCAAIALTFGLIAAPSSAQSLGDLARQEEARRATAKKAVKTLTNADLAPSEIASPVADAAAPVAAKPGTPAPCDSATSPDKCAAAEAAPADSKADAKPEEKPVQREDHWRRNADDLRRQLDKARSEYDVIARAADNVSRSAGERAAAQRVATQQLRVIESIERNWERLERDAAALKVPREWLDPRPTLSRRILQ